MIAKLSPENIFDDFPRLSDKDCVFIMQTNLLEAFRAETYFELQLIEKLMSLPDPGRDDLTKSLNAAVKKNRQTIAGVPIGEWIGKYITKYSGVPRNPNTFFEYCSKNPEIQKLSRIDRTMLMRLLRMYDYLLVEPVQDLEYPIENILRFSMQTESSLAEISAQIQSAPQGVPHPEAPAISEKLPLRELLRKYPAVGEQLITAGQLKLSSFDRPARPSVRNWIYDYTSQLGQERHNSMQRMKYLFGSPNGKNLASPDREKLGIILKSFDEDVPLSVDAKRNEIVFDFLEPAALPEAGQAWNTRPQNGPRPAAPKPVFQTAVPAPMAPISSEKREESFVKPYSKPVNPAKNYPAIEAKPAQTAEPKPVQNNFVRPYERPREKPKMPTQSTTKSIPERPAFSPKPVPKIRPEPVRNEFDKIFQRPIPIAPSSSQPVTPSRTFANSPKPAASEMRYSNPYPEPETHEPQFARPTENISSISFTEGLPKKASPDPKTPPAPQLKTVSPPMSDDRPRKTIFAPIGRNRPEPKINGNTVDLSEKKS